MSRKSQRVDYGWSNPQVSEHRIAGQTVSVTTWEGQTPGGSYMYRATLTLQNDSWPRKTTTASSSREEVTNTVLRLFEDALQ